MVGTLADVSPAQPRQGRSRGAGRCARREFRLYSPICVTMSSAPNFVTEQFNARGYGRVLFGDSPPLKSRLVRFPGTARVFGARIATAICLSV